MTLIYLSSRHKLQNVKNVGVHERNKPQIKTLKIFDPKIVQPTIISDMKLLFIDATAQ